MKSKNCHLIVVRVNLKLKCEKDDNLLGSYDIDRLWGENLGENFLKGSFSGRVKY